MSYRFDLHVHSAHSKDARGSVLELAEAAAAAGLHGFCLTDHDTVSGHEEMQQAAEATGLLIIPGIEVTAADGHILAIGCRHPIQKGMGLAETAAFIHQHGGIAVPSHPLRFLSGIGPQALADAAAAGHIHAAEGLNARERPLVHDNTMRSIHQHGIAATGGSDAHWIRDIGNAYTVFDDMPNDAGALVRRIRDGLCEPGGQSTRRRSVIGHQLSLALPPLRRAVLARQDAKRIA